MNISNITTAVDQLGVLQAQIADLSKQADDLKVAIIEQAGEDGRVEGEIFAATVSHITGQTRFDAKLAKSYLTDEQIENCMVPAKDQVRVTVRART